MSSWRRLPTLIRRVASRGTFWWIIVIAAVLATGILLSRCYWEELRSNQESLSTTVRNVGFVIGGVVAILLTVWRSIVAARQADTAQQGLLNERYQKGAEMLGSDILSVRLGGIYALQRLAEDDPEQYHIQIMQLFCAFVRNPPEIKEGQDKRDAEDEPFHRPLLLREDVQDVMTAIGGRSKEGLDCEEETNNFWLALYDADLGGVTLVDANLSGVNLSAAFLIHANLFKVDLSGAHLVGANLSRMNAEQADFSSTKLAHANLSHAYLSRTDLSDAHIDNADLTDAALPGTNLSGAIFAFVTRTLTQPQLDMAKADPDNPPKLNGAVDAETGEPLVWHGKPFGDDE